MNKIEFTKMVASGNDFVVLEGYKAQGTTYKSLAKSICDRKLGVGADGVLVLEKSKVADIRMRIFNADGSEAEMCGNGARCAALYIAKSKSHKITKSEVKLATKAGIIEAEVLKENIRIKLTEPRDIKLGISIKVNNRALKVNFVNTGVPHIVIFVDGLDKIDVDGLGRQIRYHEVFAPAGTNVNFIEVLDGNSIKIRTYERGVEGETLACGTGSVASALILALSINAGNKVNVHTKSGEILKVYFNKDGHKFSDVWLQGRAGIVYKGVYNV